MHTFKTLGLVDESELKQNHAVRQKRASGDCRENMRVSEKREMMYSDVFITVANIHTSWNTHTRQVTTCVCARVCVLRNMPITHTVLHERAAFRETDR